MGEKEKALSYFIAANNLIEETAIRVNKDAVLLNIGSCYEDANTYDLALNYYKQAEKFAGENQLLFRQEIIFKSLASVYQKMGLPDSSIYYKDLQIQLNDSLDNVNKETKMMEIEATRKNAALNKNGSIWNTVGRNI